VPQHIFSRNAGLKERDISLGCHERSHGIRHGGFSAYLTSDWI
jgi:hypothetical protein